MNNKCCVVLTTTDDHDVAVKIAKSLIHGKLAACVQIEEVSSYFADEGDVQEVNEYRLMIKASDATYNDVAELVKLEHNYDLPQIVKIMIDDASEEYMNWLLRKD